MVIDILDWITVKKEKKMASIVNKMVSATKKMKRNGNANPNFFKICNSFFLIVG